MFCINLGRWINDPVQGKVRDVGWVSLVLHLPSYWIYFWHARVGVGFSFSTMNTAPTDLFFFKLTLVTPKYAFVAWISVVSWRWDMSRIHQFWTEIAYHNFFQLNSRKILRFYCAALINTIHFIKCGSSAYKNRHWDVKSKILFTLQITHVSPFSTLPR